MVLPGCSGQEGVAVGGANIWLMAKETLFILTTVTCSPSPHITASHTVHCDVGSLAAAGETF